MANEVQTVEFVDLEKYSGIWYEIARYPKWFEKKMTNVIAEYIPEKDYIKVINSGVRSGERRRVEGKAYVVENTGNAVLKVSFFGPFKGDYRIIDLEPDYKWAVVSDKKMKSLWILSRTAQLDQNILKAILERLSQKGYDLQKLEFTNQS